MNEEVSNQKKCLRGAGEKSKGWQECVGSFPNLCHVHQFHNMYTQTAANKTKQGSAYET
jgi:hypothetical protein